MGSKDTTSPGSPPGRARIVVGEASPFVTAGLRAALGVGGMDVVAAVPNAEQACSVALATSPDAVLLSLDLPGGVTNAVRRICAQAPAVEVVVLADHADDTTMLALVDAGVHGILLGVADPIRLPKAVAGVLAGEAAFPRRLVRAMADELARRDRHRRSSEDLLTGREIEVLELLASGATASEVARRMEVAEATVRRHVANAAQKLGAQGRAETLCAFARRSTAFPFAPQ